MIQRCTNPNNPDFHHYGGRGIEVDARWRDFRNFLADMGERPIGTTIERNDNDRGYCKANCRWATQREQTRNQRGLRLVEFRGETMLLADAIRLSGIPVGTFDRRLYVYRWSVERALSQPLRQHTRK